MELKPLFEERIQEILQDKKDYSEYKKTLESLSPKSLRCNTLKISSSKLKQRLERKGWKLKQPWKDYPEIMVVQNRLKPGELGRSIEHQLGYYYVQELSSMLPIIALAPRPNETLLDLCASPGSKTTQAASEMKNSGTIIANEVSFGRVPILAANLERCGVTNTLITKKDGIALCKRMKERGYFFDNILVDAPCSGEGTLRSTPRTCKMWNINTIKQLSNLQKKLLEKVFEVLKVGGEMIYSTCTHAPEENEAVVDWFLKNFKDKVEIQKISLPLKSREGITEWQGDKFSPDVKHCHRIYPQDNNTEGFFLAKFKKVKE
jgi:NOL1/NOP2/sun family putative RNA methylase